LGGLDTVRALKGITANVLQCQKIQPLITDTVAKYTRLVSEIMEAIKTVNEKMPTFGAES